MCHSDRLHPPNQGATHGFSGYNTVMDVCAKAGDPQSAEFWLQRMVERGIEPNVVSFATVIHGFARKGDERRAQHWQGKMLEMGVEPEPRQQIDPVTSDVY